MDYELLPAALNRAVDVISVLDELLSTRGLPKVYQLEVEFNGDSSIDGNPIEALCGR
jgi:hypothetical protein